MTDREVTPTPLLPNPEKYRGAVVEDLQLPPAFSVPQNAPLSLALEKAYEREFDQLPVLNENRKPIGYLNVPLIKSKFESGQIGQADPISAHATYFTRGAGSTYRVITPLTPLEELEMFFITNGTDFAMVTDEKRKWVLAVATKSDLETFAKRRGNL